MITAEVAKEVTHCGSCGDTHLSTILDLGDQPLAENDNGRRYPLRLVKCGICTLVQLSHIPDQREIFPGNHPYVTGNTAVLRNHFSSLAKKLAEKIPYAALMVDIGANDGTLLQAVHDATGGSCRLTGVEPTDQASRCRERQEVRVWQEFFTAKVAADIVQHCGRAHIVTACNVFAHVPDPHDFLEGVLTLLVSNGTFITENHDWGSVVNGLQIDTVYHEHLRYYSISSLSWLLASHGLIVTDVEKIATHGGSFRVYAQREDSILATRAELAASKLKQLLKIHAGKGAIYGIGASTRATPLTHYTSIQDLITFICEVSGSSKIGLTLPGTEILIVDEAKLIDDQPPYALLLAWHIADNIVPRLREAGYRGRFIIPLPEPRFYNG